MNHDVLITAVPSRVDQAGSLIMALRAAERHAPESRFRYTVVMDGQAVWDLDAHRLIVHKFSQGIAFAVQEWVSGLSLTAQYYGGSSERTQGCMSFRPEMLTMLQDDVSIKPDFFSTIESVAGDVFRNFDWFTGYDPVEHKEVRRFEVSGRAFVQKRMGCAVHLTAPMSVWCARMPIPKLFGPSKISPGGTAYARGVERGNPSKSPRLGSRLEHWLQGDAPCDHRGTVVLPDMVKHVGGTTWNA